MNTDFKIVPLQTTEDYKRYTEIFAPTETPKPIEKLDWLHLHNTVGKHFVDCSVPVAQPEITSAIYAVAPVKFTLGDKDAIACQSLDTMTDARYRGKGLFITLAESVYARCADAGLALVYGFPNDQSAKGFFTKLKWKEIAKPPFLTKPLRVRYFSDKLIKNKLLRSLVPQLNLYRRKKVELDKGMEIRKINRFDKEVNTVWHSFAKNINVAIERNERYLNWRIFDNPDEQYVVNGLYQNDKLYGYIIYSIKEKHGGKIGYVMELMMETAHEKYGQSLLNDALNDMRDAKTDAALCWAFDHAPNFNLYKKAGFLKIPEKYQFIKLFFGARALQESAIDIYDVKNWYISYLDSDTN